MRRVLALGTALLLACARTAVARRESELEGEGALEPVRDEAALRGVPSGVEHAEYLGLPDAYAAKAADGAGDAGDAARVRALAGIRESEGRHTNLATGATGATGAAGRASSSSIQYTLDGDVTDAWRDSLNDALSRVEHEVREHEGVVPEAVAAKREYVFPYVAPLLAAERRAEVAREELRGLRARTAAMERHLSAVKLEAKPAAGSEDARFLVAMRDVAARADARHEEAEKARLEANARWRLVEMGKVAAAATESNADSLAADGAAGPAEVRAAVEKAQQMRRDAEAGEAAAVEAAAQAHTASDAERDAARELAHFRAARAEAIRKSERALAELRAQVQHAEGELAEEERRAREAGLSAGAQQEQRLVEENDDLLEEVQRLRERARDDALLRERNERLRQQNARLERQMRDERDRRRSLEDRQRASVKKQLLQRAFEAGLAELRAVRERAAAYKLRRAYRNARDTQAGHEMHLEGGAASKESGLAAAELGERERALDAELDRIERSMHAMDVKTMVPRHLREAAAAARAAEVQAVKRRALSVAARREAERYEDYMRQKLAGDKDAAKPAALAERARLREEERREEEARRQREAAQASERAIESAEDREEEAAKAVEREAERQRAEAPRAAGRRGSRTGRAAATGATGATAAAGATGPSPFGESAAPVGDGAVQSELASAEEQLEEIAKEQEKAGAEGEREAADAAEEAVAGPADGGQSLPTVPGADAQQDELRRAEEEGEAEANEEAADEFEETPPETYRIPDISYVPDPRKRPAPRVPLDDAEPKKEPRKAKKAKKEEKEEPVRKACDVRCEEDPACECGAPTPGACGEDRSGASCIAPAPTGGITGATATFAHPEVVGAERLAPGPVAEGSSSSLDTAESAAAGEDATDGVLAAEEGSAEARSVLNAVDIATGDEKAAAQAAGEATARGATVVVEEGHDQVPRRSARGAAGEHEAEQSQQRREGAERKSGGYDPIVVDAKRRNIRGSATA